MGTRAVPALLAGLSLGALLAGCGQSLPSGSQLVRRVALAMARTGSYRISGKDRQGTTTTSFRVLVRQNGDFAGSLTIAVPHTPTFRSQIVALGERVYVRSPAELQELGITALPGNLSPSTTWVLQPQPVARGYRRSLAPFVGTGLGATLRWALRGTLTVRRAQLGGDRVLVVQEVGGSSSLRLFVQPTTDRLLELAISGSEPVTLDYGDFGATAPVSPPPSPSVYVPPATTGAG